MDREVDEQTYYALLPRLGAVQDMDPAVHKPGGIGRVEQWRAPDGRICAWVQVNYWRGEHDVLYFIADGFADPD